MSDDLLHALIGHGRLVQRVGHNTGGVDTLHFLLELLHGQSIEGRLAAHQPAGAMRCGAIPILVALADADQATVTHVDGDQQLLAGLGGDRALTQDHGVRINIVVDGGKLIDRSKPHALNDARSAALLCIHLGLIRGLNEYKETVENRNGIVESYEFEEPYADIGDALSDDYVVSFECPHCGEIVWGENWIRKTGTNLLSLSQCSDGQEYLISLKFRPIAENKVVVKRLVYALTDELRTDYQQCMEQAAAWSKYVIPAYSF